MKVISMNRIVRRLSVLLLLATAPVCAQALYPVRAGAPANAQLTVDHKTFVVDKPFEYKLVFGLPSEDKLWFQPNSKMKMMVLWLRIQNVSDHPLDLKVEKFTATDDQGKSYPILSVDEAFSRVIEVTGPSQSLLGKTMHSASLGRAANKLTPDQLKRDAGRHSLQSGQIPPQQTQDGLIYFDGAPKKKDTINVGLGDLWSKPFVFKPK
jgi:hypothetical protein